MNKVLPKAVLFDWDGTLVNSWPTIHESMNLTLTEMGLKPWTMDQTMARARMSLRESFPVLFGDRWEEAREIFYIAYRSMHLEQVEKIDGADELVRFLSGRGCHLAVVSNKSGRHLRAESKKLNWDSYFTGYLVGSGDAARDKPATDPVQLALNKTGILPGSDIWFVGDTWVDIACGRASGCFTILLGDNDKGASEYEEHCPHESFNSCRDFFEVVKKI